MDSWTGWCWRSSATLVFLRFCDSYASRCTRILDALGADLTLRSKMPRYRLCKYLGTLKKKNKNMLQHKHGQPAGQTKIPLSTAKEGLTCSLLADRTLLRSESITIALFEFKKKSSLREALHHVCSILLARSWLQRICWYGLYEGRVCHPVE